MTNPHRPMIDSGIFVKKRASVTASVTASATASVTPAGSGGKRPESVDARRPTARHMMRPGQSGPSDPIADPIPARVYPVAENGLFIVPSLRHDAMMGSCTRRRRRIMPMVAQRHKKQKWRLIPPLSSFLFLFPPFSLFPFFFSFSFARYYRSTSTKFEPTDALRRLTVVKGPAARRREENQHILCASCVSSDPLTERWRLGLADTDSTTRARESEKQRLVAS